MVLMTYQIPTHHLAITTRDYPLFCDITLYYAYSDSIYHTLCLLLVVLAGMSSEKS